MTTKKTPVPKIDVPVPTPFSTTRLQNAAWRRGYASATSGESDVCPYTSRENFQRPARDAWLSGYFAGQSALRVARMKADQCDEVR